MTGLKQIADLIRSGVANKIVIIAGAGLSTASGLPDFRSPGSGLYHNLEKYNLPFPTAVFDIDFFDENPVPFFEVAKALYPGLYAPNEGHFLARLLLEKNMLLRFYTQNIDGLETLAGIPASKLVEAHGSFVTATCRSCGENYRSNDIKDIIFQDQVPKCSKCSTGVIKPNIVFFGEMLPDRYYLHNVDMPMANMLIVMGTSLQVQPFASIADMVGLNVPRLLINRDAVGSFYYDPRPNDVIYKGDITAGVLELCKQLNWEEQLKDLVDMYKNRPKDWAEKLSLEKTSNRWKNEE